MLSKKVERALLRRNLHNFWLKYAQQIVRMNADQKSATPTVDVDQRQVKDALFEIDRHFLLRAEGRRAANHIAAVALRHLDLMIAEKGEYLAVREMRKHAAWYLHGLPGCTKVKTEIYGTGDIGQAKRIISEYLGSL